jgi:hypothetical protein
MTISLVIVIRESFLFGVFVVQHIVHTVHTVHKSLIKSGSLCLFLKRT